MIIHLENKNKCLKGERKSSTAQATNEYGTLFAVLLSAGAKHSAYMVFWLGFLHRKEP